MLSITSPIQDVEPSLGKSLVNHDLQITPVMGAEGQNRSKKGITRHPYVRQQNHYRSRVFGSCFLGYPVLSFNKNIIQEGSVARCTNTTSAKQNIHSADIYRDPAGHQAVPGTKDTGMKRDTHREPLLG